MNCPVCGAVVETDFGIIDCSQCGTRLSVQMDGQILVADQEPVHSLEPTEFVVAPAESPQFEASPVSTGSPSMDFLETPRDPEGVSEVDLELESPDPRVESHSELAPDKGPMSSGQFRQNLTEFASELNSKGAFRYILRIRGINSPGDAVKIKEILKLSKFNEVTFEVTEVIDTGYLELAGLSSPQAMVLVQLLSKSHFHCEWEQSYL